MQQAHNRPKTATNRCTRQTGVVRSSPGGQAAFRPAPWQPAWIPTLESLASLSYLGIPPPEPHRARGRSRVKIVNHWIRPTPPSLPKGSSPPTTHDPSMTPSMTSTPAPAWTATAQCSWTTFTAGTRTRQQNPTTTFTSRTPPTPPPNEKADTCPPQRATRGHFRVDDRVSRRWRGNPGQGMGHGATDAASFDEHSMTSRAY